MPHAKSVAALGAAAMILCGCSAVVKPPQGRGQISDPRTASGRFQCLVADRLPAREVGRTNIQIGPLPAGPTVQFLPTEGAAQALQIDGKVQSAEVIGSALLYPHRAGDGELTRIENCLDAGVPG
jgi:hypothetical protein